MVYVWDFAFVQIGMPHFGDVILWSEYFMVCFLWNMAKESLCMGIENNLLEWNNIFVWVNYTDVL